MTNDKHPVLYRGNLRNLIRILSYISVLFFKVNLSEIVIGFVLLGIGCVVHYVTKGELVRNVIMCNNGIYGIVRHPYYMANYLIDVSFCLLSGSPYLLVLYPFLFFWAYGPTLRKEERFLTETHNKPYVEYMLEVPQVFPDSDFAKYLKEIFSGFSTKRISPNEISRIMRFWATAFFILFLHTIKGVDFGKMDYSILYKSYPILLGGLLYILSLLVGGKREVIL
jgi:hypothetical protein